MIPKIMRSPDPIDYLTTDVELTSVANAIRAKGNTNTPLEYPDEFITAIQNIPAPGVIQEDGQGNITLPETGDALVISQLTVTANGTYTASETAGYNPVIVNVGQEVEEKDVNFIDYDGTLLYSYMASEFANLSAFPNNPSHEGLTAQGWNWSLSDAKTYVAECGSLCIGQMYITDDGKTRVYINIPNTQLTISVGLAVDGTAVVDWGDESATDTLTGTSTTTVVSTQHTYAAPGDYVISIDVTGEASIVGTAYQGSNIYSQLVYDQSSYRISQYLGSRVSKIEIGENITSLGVDALGKMLFDSITMPNTITQTKNGAFAYCGTRKGFVFPSSVTSIVSGVDAEMVSIPNGITSFPGFPEGCSLKKINVPDTVTYWPSRNFTSCLKLSEITIPESVSVTSIGYTAFSGCWSLKKFVIPITVTSIDNAAFYNCFSLSEIHVKPTTPPTLNSSAFTGIPTTCVIYVPAASLEAYKAATNWTTYASQMVGE